MLDADMNPMDNNDMMDMNNGDEKLQRRTRWETKRAISQEREKDAPDEIEGQIPHPDFGTLLPFEQESQVFSISIPERQVGKCGTLRRVRFDRISLEWHLEIDLRHPSEEEWKWQDWEASRKLQDTFQRIRLPREMLVRFGVTPEFIDLAEQL